MSTIDTDLRSEPDPGPDTPRPLFGTPARLRTAAIVASVVAIVCAVLVPVLPVTQQQSSVQWPQSGTTTDVSLPLMSYAPTSLTVEVPCAAGVDRPDTVLFGTLPPRSPAAAKYGLIVQTVGSGPDARIEALVRDTVLIAAPYSDLAGGDCTLRVESTAERTIASITGAGTDRTETFDRDLRPQVVGLFSELEGGAPAGMRADVLVDSRFSSSPTVLKAVVAVLAVLATIVALFLLARLDALDGRRPRRVLPSRWWSVRPIDAVVVGVLLVWHVIGANTSDDGYQFNMARSSLDSGYMANFFRWLGVPENPFGTPYYDLLAQMSQISTASVWMRLPALLAAIAAWWVISREVAPRLGVATRRAVPLWTAAFVFLAFWLPYNNGLRPEPIVALGVLLTWCSVERAVATRRLLPAAIAIVTAAFTLTVGPSGIICFAALLAGARPIVAMVLARGRRDGWFATLLPLLASGVIVLPVIFFDQTLAAVLEMQRVHAFSGPSQPWFFEYLRYQWLLQLTIDGSLSRRFPVFVMIVGLAVVFAAMLRRQGRIPGTALGPSRRVVGVVAGAMILMMFTPTKWTHHFGVFAGLTGALALLVAVSIGPAVVRSARNRALSAGLTLFLVAMCFVSWNGFWSVSSWGVPWWDKPPTLLGFGLSTYFFGLALVAFVVAAYFHVRPGPSVDVSGRRAWTLSPLLVVAVFMVVVEVGTMAKAAVSQYPAYSVGRSNIDALTGSPCGLADDVLIETDPTASLLTPVSGDVAGGLSDGSTGFTPNGVASDLTADDKLEDTQGTANSVDPSQASSTPGASAGIDGGFGATGVNGSSVALPYGLDPARTPVLGSYESPGVNDLTTQWYALPTGDDRGDLVTVAAAGRIAAVDQEGVQQPGQELRLEFAGPDGAVLASEQPLDIGPQPSWRDLRVPMDRVPAEATQVRIVAHDRGVAPDDWLAVTPPRVPRTTPVSRAIGDQPALIDWMIGFNFPCQRMLRHANGIAEVPTWRILPDRTGAAVTDLWEDHYGGGPLGWIDTLLVPQTVPSFLKDDWGRDWGSVQRYTPRSRDAVPAAVDVEDVRRSGLWTPGPMVLAW